MLTCKKCGRVLKEDENDLCPACKSEKDSNIKKVLSIGVTVIGVAVRILTKGKLKIPTK